MKWYLLTIIILGSMFSCKEKDTSYSKNIPYALRSVEGQPDTIWIDTITTLDNLVDSLKLTDNLVETGKWYWIGYTNTMFSIAYKQREALPHLIDIIKFDSSYKNKILSIYTIYLIGINSKTMGREIENFEDTVCRKVLVSLLDSIRFRDELVPLLRRDPWELNETAVSKYLKDYETYPFDYYHQPLMDRYNRRHK